MQNENGTAVNSFGISSAPILHPFSPALRLLVIPFLVYLAWLLEIFLLAGNPRLLEHPEPAGIALYTIAGCILTGMIIPILCIRKAFISGDVTMFQIGFRTFRRTLLACSVTCTIGIGMIMLFNPFGADRLAFANAFILLLPTAVSSVMVCWVLAGTHLQAFVRSGGALLSVTTGVVITSLLFATVCPCNKPVCPAGGDHLLAGLYRAWCSTLLLCSPGCLRYGYRGHRFRCFFWCRHS